jgi:C-terminal processing protease CtpA/Prc
MQNRTTVGLMLEDGVITNMLVGAPAAMSKKFQKGDKVVAVDGRPTQPGQIVPLLVGEDVPGTTVNITVQRGPQQIMATLMRTSTKALADRRRMFQLFTKLEVRYTGDERRFQLAHQKANAETNLRID